MSRPQSRVQNELPQSKANVEDRFKAEQDNAAVEAQGNTGGQPRFPDEGPGVDFFADWALRIAGLVAALTFGVFSALSWKVTSDGNIGNDEAQSSLLDAVADVTNQVSSAAYVQSTALASMNERLEAVGQLRVLEVCATFTAEPACETFLSAVEFGSLVSYLGGVTTGTAVSPTTTASEPSSDSTSIPTASPGRLASSQKIAIGVGVSLGFLVLVATCLAYLDWKAKKRLARRQ